MSSFFLLTHILEDGSPKISQFFKIACSFSLVMLLFASSFLADRLTDLFNRTVFPLISSSSRSKSVPLLQQNDAQLDGICASITVICYNASVKIVATAYQHC